MIRSGRQAASHTFGVSAPRINPRWRSASQELPVSHKKEIFYRFLLPLVLHANRMVRERRERLAALRSGELTLDSPL